ncbi:MAG: serine hydrolase [Candidatus Pacearchaeota archaeon]|jgi:beta-lactamase class A
MKKDRVFFVIIMILLVINLILTYQSIQNNKSLNKYIQKSEDYKRNDLLSPDITWRNAQGLINHREEYKLSYYHLKLNITRILNQSSGYYGLYLEDLNTGAWIGLNERERFTPASLLKIPIMIMILKKVENGELDLNQKVILTHNDIDYDSGELYKKGVGYELTIQELLIYLMKHSDNTAAKALIKFTDEDDLDNAFIAAELPPLSNITDISPKEYSNILRLLYYSTYLKPYFSQLALSNMMDTEFNSQLPAKLSKDIKVAHKVGFNDELKIFHDCGIIYIPKNPYILCVMSKNSSLDESNKIISEISKGIYDFTQERMKE